MVATYDGFDCLADKMSPQVMAAKKVLQAKVPFADQAAYGKYTVYFGVSVIFVALVKYLWILARDRAYLKSQKQLGYAASTVNMLIAYSRMVGYLQVPAAASYYMSLPQSFGLTLFMFVSSLYVYLYCLVPHFWYRGCHAFGAPPLAVRSGIMATSLTPFVYVLAGKSNIITLLTGFSYEKLNVYHQYVGVTALILSIIHTIPFIWQDLHEGGNSNLAGKFRTDVYYYSGIPPLVLLFVLCVASKAVVRKFIYETFYHLHWACGIAYVGTLIWHVNNTLDCNDYMWGAIAFWGSQLLYRILIKTAFRPNKMFLKPRVAYMRRLSDRAFEIVVENTVGYKWKPGQHVFVRFSGSRILDNHPFSICSTLKLVHETEDETLPMKFIIVPKKGLTAKLHGMLDHDVVEKKVYIDGAYGGSPRNHLAFDRVILMASGSGVTATLPFLVSIAQDIAHKRATGTPIVTAGVNFVWIVRHTENVEWIREELQRCQEMAADLIKIDIFVTRDAGGTSDINNATSVVNGLESKEDSLKYDDEIKGYDCELMSENSIHYFKPNVVALLDKLKHTLGRRNMVVSSGSDSMKMCVSNKVAEMQSLIINGGPVEEIYLHTESFGW